MRGLLRTATALATGAVCGFAMAGTKVHRVLLVPLDDRPATTQFAQMIGDLADVAVETPPEEFLGRFLQPGKPERINAWLKDNLQNYDAVILNTEMIAYGGLIASRSNRSSLTLAVNRLREFWKIRKLFPHVKVYGFSAVMRLAPTATKENKTWRQNLAKYAELSELVSRKPDPKLKAQLDGLKAKVPAKELEKYYAVRSRDLKIQQELLRMTAAKVFDTFALGQDDAKPAGPHVPETAQLKSLASRLGIKSRVHFAAGIDQLANVLLSRALLEGEAWKPKVRVVYADEAGRQKVAFYESGTVDSSLRDQIVGSGAVFAKPGESFDYSLYVNTPDPQAFALDAFLKSMKNEVDQGFPVAVADVNLGAAGIADPRLFDALTSEGRSSRVLAYAGWNTAGNTMGTTIPAANIYLLARKVGVTALKRETSLRAFILHRLVNDFEYHKYVRPEAYAMIDSMPRASREETYGTEFNKVDELVRNDLGERLSHRFKEQLLGTRFFADSQQYEVVGLRDVSIALPWPRAYEVKLSFGIDVASVEALDRPFDRTRFPLLPLGDG